MTAEAPLGPANTSNGGTWTLHMLSARLIAGAPKFERIFCRRY